MHIQDNDHPVLPYRSFSIVWGIDWGLQRGEKQKGIHFWQPFRVAHGNMFAEKLRLQEIQFAGTCCSFGAVLDR